ncbi:MAG TPA: T9SS type A sorting domain-containing protein, partial [Bacteroidales bacterium]|nr:T9SS type A sorting domain-containing protein [Bacteroidales bacterium]
DIIDNNASTTITVYPNPSNDQLKIETGNEVIKEIILYDLTGKQIKHLLINEINASIDISDLYKGMYFIQIKTEKGEVKKKFIKL